MERIFKKLTNVLFIFTMIFGIFMLNGCVSSNLAKYKIEAKEEIDVYAATKEEANYSVDNWVVICNVVIEGKLAVDAAGTKIAINTAVSTSKAIIDDVPKNFILTIFVEKSTIQYGEQLIINAELKIKMEKTMKYFGI